MIVYYYHYKDMELDMATDFFKGDKVAVTNHEEWLLREYTKMLHRECQVTHRERQVTHRQSNLRPRHTQTVAKCDEPANRSNSSDDNR
jgi:hypothetical protein